MAQDAGYVICDLQPLTDNSNFVSPGESVALQALTIAVELLTIPGGSRNNGCTKLAKETACTFPEKQCINFDNTKLHSILTEVIPDNSLSEADSSQIGSLVSIHMIHEEVSWISWTLGWILFVAPAAGYVIHELNN